MAGLHTGFGFVSWQYGLVETESGETKMNNLDKQEHRFTVIEGGKTAKKPYSQMDDAELVVLCKKKDQRAFEVLVKRHQRNVCAMLYKMAPDWNDTADLAQEVFIKIWRGIDKLQNPNALQIVDGLRSSHAPLL